MEWIRGKWYEPIIRRVETFEDESEVFQEVESVTRDLTLRNGLSNAL